MRDFSRTCAWCSDPFRTSRRHKLTCSAKCHKLREASRARERNQARRQKKREGLLEQREQPP
jgi:hypothetical protein